MPLGQCAAHLRLPGEMQVVRILDAKKQTIQLVLKARRGLPT